MLIVGVKTGSHRNLERYGDLILISQSFGCVSSSIYSNVILRDIFVFACFELGFG